MMKNKKKVDPCSWWILKCDFCGSGLHKLRMNRNRRIICHFCFVKHEDEYEFKEVESELYDCDEDENPGTEGKSLDIRGQDENDEQSSGEEEMVQGDLLHEEADKN